MNKQEQNLIDFKTIEERAEYYAHNNFEMHETNNYKALLKGYTKGAEDQKQIDENLAIDLLHWIGVNQYQFCIKYNLYKKRFINETLYYSKEELFQIFQSERNK